MASRLPHGCCSSRVTVGARSAPVRDRAPVLRDLHYLGGHPAAPSELDRIDMVFDDAGITFARGAERLGSIPWPEVVDVSVDAEFTTDRTTAPRLMLLGILAAWFTRRERRVL